MPNNDAMMASVAVGLLCLATSYYAAFTISNGIVEGIDFGDGPNEAIRNTINNALEKTGIPQESVFLVNYEETMVMQPDSKVAFYVNEFNPEVRVRYSFACRSLSCKVTSGNSKQYIKFEEKGVYLKAVATCEKTDYEDKCNVVIEDSTTQQQTVRQPSRFTTKLHEDVYTAALAGKTGITNEIRLLKRTSALEKPLQLFSGSALLAVIKTIVFLADYAKITGVLIDDYTFFPAAAAKYGFTYPDGSATEKLFVDNMRAKANAATRSDFDWNEIRAQALEQTRQETGLIRKGVTAILPLETQQMMLGLATGRFNDGTITPMLAIAYADKNFDDPDASAVSAMAVFANERAKQLEANGGSDNYPAIMAQNEITWLARNETAPNATIRLMLYKDTTIDFSRVRPPEANDTAWLKVSKEFNPYGESEFLEEDGLKIMPKRGMQAFLTTTRECDATSCKYVVYLHNGHPVESENEARYISAIGAGT